MTASGAYRDIRVCAGIVGNADCILDRLLEVLLIEALRSTAGTAASPGLLRGLADESALP